MAPSSEVPQWCIAHRGPLVQYVDTAGLLTGKIAEARVWPTEADASASDDWLYIRGHNLNVEPPSAEYPEGKPGIFVVRPLTEQEQQVLIQPKEQ